MKKNKQLDFENKLAFAEEIGAYYGWQLVFTNPSIGQIHFAKDRVNVHLYTTKMTVVINGKLGTKSHYHQTMDNLDNILENVEKYL